MRPTPCLGCHAQLPDWRVGIADFRVPTENTVPLDTCLAE